MAGIVVGVNGSPNARHALDWAVQHAVALQTPVTVLAVHEVPKSYWGNMPVTGPGDANTLAAMRSGAENLVRQVTSPFGTQAPPVEVKAVNGFVVRELVNASREADLVVLGTPSGSGFSRLVTGSVGHEVLQHSRCPVVIVPQSA